MIRRQAGELSAMSGWAFGAGHLCYDVFGHWSGAKPRCLVIMKTCTDHNLPSSLQLQEAASPSPPPSRIYHCSFSPPRSPLHPRLASRLGPPVHLLNCNHSSNSEGSGRGGGGEAPGWGKQNTLTHVITTKSSLHGLELNPLKRPRDVFAGAAADKHDLLFVFLKASV